MVADVVRAAVGGVIPPRVAEATEGVLKAMFAKKLRAAAESFSLLPQQGDPTAGHTGAVVADVAEPIETTVTLLGDSADGLSDVTVTALFVLLTSDVPALPPY